MYTSRTANATMLSITAIWFCLKRMPRILALVFNVIVIFLSIFLLIGCYNNSNLSIFLVNYRFQEESPFYSVIKKSFQQVDSNNSSLSGLESVVVKAGYMGVCILNLPNVRGAVCYPRKDLSNTTYYNDLSIELFNIPSQNTSSTTAANNIPIKLNILQLAQLTSVEIIHPYLLMATIALSIIMFLLILYAIIPKLPKKYFVNRFLLIWSSSLTLLWGFGSMWTHVAINASYELVPRASLGIIETSKGKKAETMSWFVFAFLLVNCLIIWFLYFRDRKKLSDEIDKLGPQKSSERYNNRYPSDSSTLSSKV